MIFMSLSSKHRIGRESLPLETLLAQGLSINLCFIMGVSM
jgi:hypothetical protein